MAIKESWENLKQQINTNFMPTYDGDGVLVPKPKITSARLKVSGNKYATDAGADPINASAVPFYFYTDDVGLNVGALENGNDQQKVGSISFDEGEVSKILSDYNPKINANTSLDLSAEVTDTNDVDVFNIEGLEIQWKGEGISETIFPALERVGNSDTGAVIKDNGYYIGPTNIDQLVEPIEGTVQNPNYLDYNDKIGNFKYTISFNGYEAYTLSTRIFSGETYTDAANYIPASIMFSTNSSSVETGSDLVKVQLLATDQVSTFEFPSATEGNITGGLVTSVQTAQIFLFNNSIKAIIPSLDLTKEQLESVMNTDSDYGTWNVWFEFTGREPVNAGTLSVYLPHWQNNDKMEWVFNW